MNGPRDLKPRPLGINGRGNSEQQQRTKARCWPDISARNMKGKRQRKAVDAILDLGKCVPVAHG
jgi:hypothetical protein